MRVHIRLRYSFLLRPFSYPAHTTPRVAVLTPWFRTPGFTDLGILSHFVKTAPLLKRSAPGQVRIFPNGWNAEAARFDPAAVAGTLEQIRTFAEVTVTHAIIVLERPDTPRLTEADRDWLWRRFGVPVFQQVIGRNGRLLATECEAHQGLHVEDPAFLQFAGTGGHRLIHSGACPCGRATPRVEFVTPRLPLRSMAQAR